MVSGIIFGKAGNPFLPAILRSTSGAKRAAAAAGRFRVRVVEDEPLADQARVVVEDGAVQVQQALLVDEDLRAVRPFEDLVAQAGLLLPGEGVAQTRAPAPLDPDAQPTLVDALLGHQLPDRVRGRLTNLDHDNKGDAGWTFS